MNFAPALADDVPTPALLRVRDLSVRRGGRRVLDAVAFELRPSEIVTVVGPNGAGKSTLLAAIVGAVRPECGEVTLRGAAVRGLHASSAAFSYLPDDAELPSEVRVEILFAHARAQGHVASALADDLLDALDLRALLPARPRELSRGERRRVALFVALATDRPIVVLDEPFGVFDPLQLRDVIALVQRRAQAGVSFLASVHQLSDAEKIANRVLALHDGRVIAFDTIGALRDAVALPAPEPFENVVVALLTKARRAAT